MAREDSIRTLLMTDVVGSTRLWAAHPDAMPAAIERMERLADEAATEHGGRVVKGRGEGDSLFCVFPNPAAAARAAVSLVLRLRETESEPVLHVRAAIHCGPAQERDGDIYGATPARCARLREVGHGDQILLSGAARAQIDASEGIGLRDVGRHRLRDLDEPETVYQVLDGTTPDNFPPLRSLTCLRNNLPFQHTTFIGRDELRRELLTRLVDDRLTTLIGAGGSGKTRLALQLGAEVIEEFPGGVWFIELADVTSEGAVARKIAESCGYRDLTDSDLLSELADRLTRQGHSLLILDNAEHALRPIGNVVAALVRTNPDIRIVTTSREPLRLRGERIHRVPPLSIPEIDDRDVLRVLDTESIRLFVDRARWHLPEFIVRESNLKASIEIVRRLDGIPLCLEMAASHVGYLGVDQIAARLHDRFQLLEDFPDGPPRHRTMREAIAWQYDSLDSEERILLQRLSAFSGIFTLEAAEVVGGGPPLDSDAVLRRLRALVDKSLVVAMPEGGEMRYRLLETIAQFALEMAAEEIEQAMSRLTDWAMKTARLAYEEIHGPGQVQVVSSLESLDGSLRKAIGWTLAVKDPRAVDLCLAMARYWYHRGRYREALAYFDRIQTLYPTSSRRLEVTNAFAVFASELGEHSAAVKALRLALEDQHLAPNIRSKVRSNLAMALSELGKKDEAFREYLLVRDDAERLGDQALARNANYNAALILSDQGRREEAIEALRRAGEAFAAADEASREAKCYSAMANCYALGGDVDSALEWLARALGIYGPDAESQLLFDVTLTGVLVAAQRERYDDAAFLIGATEGFELANRGIGFERCQRTMAEARARMPSDDETLRQHTADGRQATLAEIANRIYSLRGKNEPVQKPGV